MSTPIPKGWCPGALRPMQSGDGLIVRVRPRAGAFPLSAVLAIADAARRCGNGHIELTRRANLQIRGVSTATLPALHDVLQAHGLLDPSPEAEAVRNVMVSPLAGVACDAVLDIRPLAQALEQALATDAELWRLPTKFGFVLDDGGTPSLDAERADIRLKAVQSTSGHVLAIGIDRPSGPLWLGATTIADALAITHSLVGRVEAALRGRDPTPGATRVGSREGLVPTYGPVSPARMRDLPERAVDAIAAFASRQLAPLTTAPAPQPHQLRLGALALSHGRIAVGIAAPFGRIDAAHLHALATAAAAAGCGELRLSPWRSLYLVAPSTDEAARVLDCAIGLGLITDTSDPLLAIDACPGAPDCASATLETRAAARALAALAPALPGVRSIHVSGCAKGCARSTAADLVLSARGDRFAVFRNGQ